MAGDLAALKTTWSGIGGSTTSKKLAILNAMMVAGPAIDVDLSVVSNFLSNNNKLQGVLAFVNNTPATPDANALLAANYLVALLAGSDGTMMPTGSVPGLLAILSQISADARTGITAGNVTAFNNICTSKIPWWQANGFSGPVTVANLIAAGNLS
jgi:hypothetical protein